MRAKVTKEGVVIPKRLLKDVDEVEIKKKDDVILVVPTAKEDPILKMGMRPITCNTPDASEQAEKYLFISKKDGDTSRNTGTKHTR